MYMSMMLEYVTVISSMTRNDTRWRGVHLALLEIVHFYLYPLLKHPKCAHFYLYPLLKHPKCAQNSVSLHINKNGRPLSLSKKIYIRTNFCKKKMDDPLP